MDSTFKRSRTVTHEYPCSTRGCSNKVMRASGNGKKYTCFECKQKRQGKYMKKYYKENKIEMLAARRRKVIHSNACI